MEFSSEPYTQSSADRITKAADAYAALIASPEAASVDIIVFPESTFNSRHQAFYIPDPEENISPCHSSDERLDPALQKISCSASETKKYVVINVTEKKNLTSEDDGEEQEVNYNANVVFDRNGVIISRYRKFNLFGESGISVTKTPDISYFTTDFNVTFGHFICFDLLFKAPAMELMKDQLHIHDIVYPTMWFSELPFLSAVQAQHMWATKHKLNFLGAGASNPDVGSTGSGIYSRDGPIKAVMAGTPLRQILVAEVPKKQYWEDPEIAHLFQPGESFTPKVDEVFMKRDHLNVYSSKLINFADGASTVHENLCYKDGLCCDFEIKVNKWAASTVNNYKYFITVFDGVRSYDGVATGGTVACAIMSSVNETIEGAGVQFASGAATVQDVIFDSIRISGKFRSTPDILMLPNTVDHRLMPLPHDLYAYEEGQDVVDGE